MARAQRPFHLYPWDLPGKMPYQAVRRGAAAAQWCPTGAGEVQAPGARCWIHLMIYDVRNLCVGDEVTSMKIGICMGIVGNIIGIDNDCSWLVTAGNVTTQLYIGYVG